MTPEERDRYESEYDAMDIDGLKFSRLVIGLRLAQVLYESCTVQECKKLFSSVNKRITKLQEKVDDKSDDKSDEIDLSEIVNI